MIITKVFRSTDTFRMNEYPGNTNYVSYKFISGLNVVGYYYDEEHDYHGYLLYFDKDSKHLPNYLAEGLPTIDHINVWNADDYYWAVESEKRSDLVPFFHRQGAKMFLPCYAEWSYEDRISNFCHKNDS